MSANLVARELDYRMPDWAAGDRAIRAASTRRAELAAHVVEVMEAILRSAQLAEPVELSDGPAPQPAAEWADALPLVTEPVPVEA